VTDKALTRCPWPGEDALYCAYHDEEWGVPEYDDRALYEKLVLDGFQAGLSWITILRKRENFRRAFDGFDPESIVRYDAKDKARLLKDAGIIRSAAKIDAAIEELLAAKPAEIAAPPAADQPSPSEDPDKDAKNESLRRFSDGLRDVAAKSGAAFIDQFDPYLAILVRERAGNPAGFVGGGDAVHPGPIGQTIMAWAVLKGLGAPALVSRVEIDAATGRLVAAEGCSIEHLKPGPSRVVFDRLDEALPMPIDERAESALKLAPILDDLDRYELRVTGLPAGSYAVTIDGEEVGKVQSEELARGWNLANAAGAVRKQAREVLKLVFEKNCGVCHTFGGAGGRVGSHREQPARVEAGHLHPEVGLDHLPHLLER
jgi:hypothetical protein